MSILCCCFPTRGPKANNLAVTSAAFFLLRIFHAKLVSNLLKKWEEQVHFFSPHPPYYIYLFKISPIRVKSDWGLSMQSYI